MHTTFWLQYKKVLDAALDLITKHHEMKLFHDALVYLGSPGNEAYKASLESTDFETLIEETILVMKNEEARYNPENDPLMECFNSTVAAIVPTAAQDEVIDDEIQIQGGSSVEKNTKCPFTMKLVCLSVCHNALLPSHTIKKYAIWLWKLSFSQRLVSILSSQGIVLLLAVD
jgi:hypothetical protein